MRGGGGDRVFGPGLATSDLYNGELIGQTLAIAGVWAAENAWKPRLEPRSLLSGQLHSAVIQGRLEAGDWTLLSCLWTEGGEQGCRLEFLAVAGRLLRA